MVLVEVKIRWWNLSEDSCRVKFREEVTLAAEYKRDIQRLANHRKWESDIGRKVLEITSGERKRTQYGHLGGNEEVQNIIKKKNVVKKK